ncbi:S1C family serine protease [Lignipirellula cremea]|uniref:Periplasmic serine endoprotease DegP n=1 Tax=Lignipirellula cremea TaxID=2528010 RepID=A0A518DZQ1_9BACT|nr:trypsin-like peptidase domain-containing protein [Lignipirellula cremea]QDU97317.1 Periplasmic serine endoprotease DegP precursor [Lignipirellula cremea]
MEEPLSPPDPERSPAAENLDSAPAIRRSSTSSASSRESSQDVPPEPADLPHTEADTSSAKTRTTRTRVHPPEPAEPDGLTWLLSKLAWIVLFLMGAALFQWAGPWAVEEIQYSITRGQERARHDAAQEFVQDHPLNQLSQMYGVVSKIVSPSVVHINTSNARRVPYVVDDEQPLALPPPDEIQGQGSGVILDPRGFIVTNYHVVRGASNIQVVISGQRPIDAVIVGFDQETDLALLRVEADNLIPAQWGDSDEIETGSLVWAIGSPFGLERSITSGILSAKHRAGKAGTIYQDFLQTDAAVNPGNSGGPLVDSAGRVIGINTAIVGQTYQGISFAIPSNVAREVVERIRASGHFSRGWLGVQLGEVTPDRAQQLGTAVGVGAYIIDVVPHRSGKSPAAEAGIIAGDVIIAWNGATIDSPNTLSQQVARTQVGSRVPVVLFRQGRQVQLEATVGERAPGM